MGAALSAHAAVLAYVPDHRSSSVTAAGPLLELDLTSDVPEPVSPSRLNRAASTMTTPAAERAFVAARAVPTATVTSSASPETAPPEEPDVAAPGSAPASGVEAAGVPLARPAGQRKAVRLFLGPKDLAELSRKVEPTEAAPDAQSVGRITEEAEAMDGSKGLSRSSAAVSAGYRSAQLGPEVGTALLEVRTDARGVVTSVSVLGDHVTDVWVLVADDLLSRLKERILRVPAGAQGLLTRLRIDRGYLAEDLSERGRVKRGVAMGQDHHEKDYGWDESTQASFGGHRPAPSLGVSSEWLRTRVKTRVSIVSQQVF
jgi:hypothetical protein